MATLSGSFACGAHLCNISSSDYNGESMYDMNVTLLRHDVYLQQSRVAVFNTLGASCSLSTHVCFAGGLSLRDFLHDAKRACRLPTAKAVQHTCLNLRLPNCIVRNG